MGNQFKSVLGLLLVHAFLAVQASGDENLIWRRAVLEGRQLQQKSSHHEAIGKFLEALQQAEAFGAGRERVALILNDLASAYSDLGDYRQAKKCSQRSLETFKQTGTEIHPGFSDLGKSPGIRTRECGKWLEQSGSAPSRSGALFRS